MGASEARRAFCFALFSVLVLISGCDSVVGRIGHDSVVQIRLTPTGETGDMSGLHLITSPNDGVAKSVAAVSDVQPQAWAVVTSTTTSREIDFVTKTQRVPFDVYIQNGSGLGAQTQLEITIDGHVSVNTVATVGAGVTMREATVHRNHATQP